MDKRMITNIHEDIIKVLVERLEKMPERAFLTYEELCKRIGTQVHYRNVASYLGDISCWCNEIGAPMLSTLVINNSSNRPGKGYYKLYAELYGKSVRSLDEEQVFISEYQKVASYRGWEKFKYYLGI